MHCWATWLQARILIFKTTHKEQQEQGLTMRDIEQTDQHATARIRQGCKMAKPVPSAGQMLKDIQRLQNIRRLLDIQCLNATIFEV